MMLRFQVLTMTSTSWSSRSLSQTRSVIVGSRSRASDFPAVLRLRHHLERQRDRRQDEPDNPEMEPHCRRAYLSRSISPAKVSPVGWTGAGRSNSPCVHDFVSHWFYPIANFGERRMPATFAHLQLYVAAPILRSTLVGAVRC
jgi:hypothetical protein